MSMPYDSAIEMAKAIAKGDIGAVEVLEACLARVNRLDGTLNAICHRVDERALARARILDQTRLRTAPRGPLHAVPMTVKEGYDLVGTPTTWGRPDFADNYPRADADAVHRFEQAGAAVALAAGYSYLEAGSDIGGSLRNPAHYCGVCAHKPTYGVLPTLGHALGDKLVPSDISVCGPMARGVDDLMLGFEIMSAVVGPDALAWQLTLPATKRATLRPR